MQSILVIDDDNNILRLIRRLLEKCGYRVLLSADGISGLAILKDQQPDLVLLDIMMPGPDGFAVLESIRKISNIPVIIVSAKPERSFIGAAADLCADDYIEKPFHSDVLIARIKAKLRRVAQDNKTLFN
jgi:DNA-binding response OmpR family regulator